MFLFSSGSKSSARVWCINRQASVFRSLVTVLKTDQQKRGKKMTLSEKRKLKSTRHSIRDPGVSLTEEQLMKLQQASRRPSNGYQPDTSFGKPTQPSEAADSGMSPFANFPDELEGVNAMAFYPSGGNPSEADRPTLVDAVIEQLRQARMRRQRPH